MVTRHDQGQASTKNMLEGYEKSKQEREDKRKTAMQASTMSGILADINRRIQRGIADPYGGLEDSHRAELQSLQNQVDALQEKYNGR